MTFVPCEDNFVGGLERRSMVRWRGSCGSGVGRDQFTRVVSDGMRFVTGQPSWIFVQEETFNFISQTAR